MVGQLAGLARERCSRTLAARRIDAYCQGRVHGRFSVPLGRHRCERRGSPIAQQTVVRLVGDLDDESDLIDTLAGALCAGAGGWWSI